MTAALQRLASAEAAGAWLHAQGARALVADSRRLARGDALLAWPGAAHDARRFVPAALASGAAACLVEADGAEALALGGEPRLAAFAGLQRAAGPIASVFLGTPSARLSVVAITGTNGKTSTAWWIAEALGRLGRRCGTVGTLGVGDDRGGFVPTGLTTPDAPTLQAAFASFVRDGYSACAVEASSIGLAGHRFDGTVVAVAVFTNLTQDHLDAHGSMAAYGDAKARLFDWPDLGAAVLHVDDAFGTLLAARVAARGTPLWTTSLDATGSARLVAADIVESAEGLSFTVVERAAAALPAADFAAPSPSPRRAFIRGPQVGRYNVANMLGVVGTLRALGVPLEDAARACTGLGAVPGRMQRVTSGSAGVGAPEVVVDYAHTPDALEQALGALRPLARARGGALWCVFGCGGNRDAAKRPRMGAIAARLADRVVVTSDNPRREAPEAIVAAVVGGVEGAALARVETVLDRSQAIARTVARAAPNDVVLIAGKGHETTQEVAGTTLPFSDVDQARAALAARAPMATLGELHALLPGSRLVGDPATPIGRVHSDTRTLRDGDLFVALRGERFDGADFLAEARAAGAVAALAERGIADAGLAGLEVADAKEALGALGAAWRARFAALPLVAVGGSNGKTTTTQMVASILRAWQGGRVLATEGNFNNEIGLPLTLLRLRDGLHTVAVVELGMNHPGEIARLAAMARATVAVVTNAQREHLEFMRDVAAVAVENGALVEALGADGTAVFPLDDGEAATWQRQAGARRTLVFGHGGAVTVAATAPASAPSSEAAPATALSSDAAPAAATSGDAARAPATSAAAAPAVATSRDAAPTPATSGDAAATSGDAAARAATSGDAAPTAATSGDAAPTAATSADAAPLAIDTPQGTIATTLAVPGAHNVRNALAATAAALAVGAPLEAIGRGLAAFRPVKGRSQLSSLALDGRRLALVDDSYNANPDSVRAAIDLLATLEGPRWLVLGDMGEVGDQGPAFHREVGAHARARGIETVWAAGAENASVVAGAAGAGGPAGDVRGFATVEALLAALAERPRAASVLVKGSRFMRMERVVQALQRLGGEA